MLIYIIVFFVAFLLFYTSEIIDKNKKVNILSFLFFFLALLSLALLAGLRDLDVGRDMQVYVVKIFNKLNSPANSNFANYYRDVNGEVELIYLLFNYYSYQFSSNIHFFLGFYTFLVLSLVSYACKKYAKVTGVSASLIFICYILFFYNISLSMMRQMLAIAFSFLAFYYVIRNNMIRFYFFALIATLAHTSALVNFILYPIVLFLHKREIKNFNVYLVVFLGILYFGFSFLFSALLSLGLLSEKYDHYLEGDKTSIQKMQILLNIILMILAIVPYFLRKNLIKKNIKLVLFTQVLFFYLGLNMVLTLLSTKMEVANREAYYFYLPLMVLLPWYWKILRFKNYFVFILLALLLNFFYMSYRTGLSDTVPYKSKIMEIWLRTNLI